MSAYDRWLDVDDDDEPCEHCDCVKCECDREPDTDEYDDDGDCYGY